MKHMKKIIISIVLIILVLILLPYLIISHFGFYTPGETKQEKTVPAKPEMVSTVKVYIKAEDKVVEMDTTEYLKGVVSAEMPVSFEMEALKAQAVAARSYLMNHIENYKKNGTPPEHKGADTCTDYKHCKAWISEADRKAKWDEKDADSNWQKISKAVEDTAGQIMVYEGQPVNAVFHSTSSGKTERAADVWGGDVPYLQSVDSEGDKVSPKYNSEVDLTVDEFKKKAEAAVEGIDWSKGLYGAIERSEAGGIISIELGGVKVKGTKFRTMFDLRSTNVDIHEENGKIYMPAKGYGHGVGMSQYGANYLASQGKNYEEILKTYYTGVEIQK